MGPRFRGIGSFGHLDVTKEAQEMALKEDDNSPTTAVIDDAATVERRMAMAILAGRGICQVQLQEYSHRVGTSVVVL